MITHLLYCLCLFGTQDPPSEAECLKLAKEIDKGLRKGDTSELNALSDVEVLLNRSLKGTKSSKGYAQGFREGVGKSYDLGRTIVAQTGKGGSYRFLRIRQIGGRPRALFRLIGESGGLNYHELVFETVGDKTRIVDIYVYLSGELLSNTFRRMFNMAAAEKGEDIDPDLLDGLSQIQRVTQLLKEGKAEEGLKVYEKLPEAMRKEKSIMLIRLQLSQRLGDKENEAAIEEYRKAFPDDASMDLISIGGFCIQNKWSDALKAVDRVDKGVGGDPYLQVMRSNVHLKAGDARRAKECARQALDEEPSLVQACWTLVEISLAEKEYEETARLLTKVEGSFGLKIGDLTVLPVYAGFVKSDAYQAWMKNRKTGVAADSLPFDPVKHAWMKWKEGSFVKFQYEGASKYTFQTQLKKVGKDDYTLLSSDVTQGIEMMEHTWKIAEGGAHCDPHRVKAGEEKLAVDGKEYGCTIWKTTSDSQGMFVKEEKVWMADGIDVPLKIEYSVTKGISAKRELKAVKIDDEVAVGKIKLKCVKLEGTHTVEARETWCVKLTHWLSSDMPGWVVREDRIDMKDKTRSSQVVIEFKAIR